jgi:hypothetical protein
MENGVACAGGDQQATNNIHAGMLFTIMTWTHALDMRGIVYF